MRVSSPVIRPAPLIFSFWIFLFGFILLDGYLLYFIRLPANPAVIFILVFLEFAALARWLRSQKPSIHGDPLELAGFLLVVVGVWLYFVYPSWPTLLPPTHSGDGANHAAEANLIFTTGHIFADYPAGPALLTATLAHWIGWSPLRLLHLSAALWVALTAGGIFGLACSMLPDRREYKVIALFAPFALFIPWGYFGGLLIDISYFSPQAFAQLCVVAFVWFLAEYVQSDHPLWLIGMGLCLIAISVSFQLWLVLPLVLFAWAMIVQWRSRAGHTSSIYRAAWMVAGSVAVFWLILVLTSRELIPNPARLNISDAAVIGPSFQELGGPFLIVPALGILLMLRRGRRARVASAFLILAALQSAVLVIANARFGFSAYWMSKSFFLSILPLAVYAVAPLAWLVEFSHSLLRRRVLSSPYAALVAFCVLGAITVFAHPPPPYSPLSESDIQAALWAKDHIDTTHINFTSRKSLVASWLGVGIWNEKYPNDLFVDLAALGPKVYEQWRNDSDWGEYLFATSKQRMPPDPTVRVVYASGNSQILQKISSVSDAVPEQAPLGQFGSTLELVDYSKTSTSFQPGSVISLTAHVRPLALPAYHVVWRLLVRDHQDNPVAESLIEPFDGKFPLQRWPDGKLLTQSLRINLPADAAPGLDSLQLGLYSSNGEPLPFQNAANTQVDLLKLAGVKIPLPTVSSQELESITHTNIKIGDSLELMGYRSRMGTPLHPGDPLQITLYWRALAPVSRDYTVFVHLLGPSGAVRAQQDTSPRGGSYPTSIWEKGEVVPDQYSLTVPSDAPSGAYQIEVGMYEWPGLQRLVAKSGDRVLGNRVLLPLQLTVAAGD